MKKYTIKRISTTDFDDGVLELAVSKHQLICDQKRSTLSITPPIDPSNLSEYVSIDYMLACALVEHVELDQNGYITIDISKPMDTPMGKILKDLLDNNIDIEDNLSLRMFHSKDEATIVGFDILS